MGRWLSVEGLPRGWLAAAFAGCAVFAGLVALVSDNSLHRFWGISAACAYGAAAVLLLTWRSRWVLDAALAAMVGGAVLVPLVWFAWHGQEQPEVMVVARSASTLIHHG